MPNATLVQILSESGGQTPVPVALATPVGGGIIWSDPVPVTLTGASQEWVPANASRKAIQLLNRVGNDKVSYSLSGSPVTLIGGIQMLAPQRDWYTGDECPVGSISVIGTIGQLVTYIEGT